MAQAPVPRPPASRALWWLVVLLWLGFAGVTWFVASQVPTVGTVEMRIALALHDVALQQSWFVDLGRLLDLLGSVLVCLGVVAVAALGLVIAGALRRPFGATTFALAMLLTSSASGALFASYVKGAVDRPRPPWNGLWVLEESGSYPSGHAQAGISVWVALGVVALVVTGSRVRWLVAVPLFILGPLIGLSRAVLGVHWPIDVLGGWLLGAACLGTSVLLFRRWLVREAGAERSRR